MATRQPPHDSKHEQPFQYEEARVQQTERARNIKNHFVAASGEFVGTIMFLYCAFSTHLMVVAQQSDMARSDATSSAQTVVFISLGYGFSLLVSAWGWYRISGGLFNPAVCISPFPHIHFMASSNHSGLE
jgi:glycerol uptake facilitator-like aquaporin